MFVNITFSFGKWSFITNKLLLNYLEFNLVNCIEKFDVSWWEGMT